MELHTTCASCKLRSCFHGTREAMPKNCPMNFTESGSANFDEYNDPEIHRFYQGTRMCVGTEEELGRTPRLRAAIDLCKYMGYKKIGLAFCGGFWKEAELYAAILRKQGFDVVSACCFTGGMNIADRGIPLPENSLRTDFDPACNPIGQAKVLNAQKTEFNLVMGLCMGHDSLFLKYSEAMCSVIAIKDGATGHNPLNALKLYDRYPEIFLSPSPRQMRETDTI